MSERAEPMGVLFVCLGNICRSPMAAAIFAHQARAAGLTDRFTIDSCGTGHWHIGQGADERTLTTLRRHKVPCGHVARQFDQLNDAANFALIVPMDRANQRDLLRLGVPAGKMRLAQTFDPAALAEGDEPEVPDPYTGTMADFESVFEMLERASAGMLSELRPERGL